MLGRIFNIQRTTELLQVYTLTGNSQLRTLTKAQLSTLSCSQSISPSQYLYSGRTNDSPRPCPTILHDPPNSNEMRTANRRHFMTSSWALADSPGGPGETAGAGGANSPFPSFPSTSEGAIIMGRIVEDKEVTEAKRFRKFASAHVFDNFYQESNNRTGRKQIGRFLKGSYVTDYYLDKNTDPLLVNVEGREQAAIRAERNERGFKRRRPQKKAAKGAGKGKGK